MRTQGNGRGIRQDGEGECKVKVSREAKERIAHIKSEVSKQKHELMTYLARLEEHAGTKRICRGLQKVIGELEHWQRS